VAYRCVSLTDLYLHNTHQILLRWEQLFVDGRTRLALFGWCVGVDQKNQNNHSAKLPTNAQTKANKNKALFTVFTAWCTLAQSTVLRSHVVCLSVTLVNCNHIGWNSSKIIPPLVSLGRSLFATPTWRVCSKGNTPKFGPKVTHPPVDLSVGDIRSQIAAEWLQIAQRSQWTAYRKLPSLFLMVPSLTTKDLPFPPKWGFMPRTYANGHISATGDSIHFMFGSRVGFSGKADRTALFTVRTNPRWRRPPSLKNFKWPYLHNRSSDPLHVLF